MATDLDTSTESIHQHAHGPANRGRRVLRTAAPLFVRFPSTEARAAVVVLHDVYGLTEGVEEHCRALARRGYLVIAPYLYYETGGKEFRTEHEETARAAMSLLAPDDLAADVSGALDHLGRRVGIPPHSIGLLGIGMGGYLASRAAVDHELAAVVAIDPLGLDLAPWPGVPDLCELLDKLNTRWLGVAGAGGLSSSGHAHALVEAAARSHGLGDARIVPDPDFDPGDHAEYVGPVEDAARFLDVRIN